MFQKKQGYFRFYSSQFFCFFKIEFSNARKRLIFFDSGNIDSQ